jgi:phosphatidylserine decarboxylase
MRALTRCGWCPLKQGLIQWFIRRYGVDLADAELPPAGTWPHFNAFFTRALRAGARALPDRPDAILCPADGRISQIGHLGGGSLVQAKDMTYTVEDLLGSEGHWAEGFADGTFLTVYLSPSDYHRVHMPISGRLREMIHIPGRLFSVAPHCVQGIPRLFARNERVVTLWETEVGPMALVLVGAIFVGSIETVWAGEVTPPRARRISRASYADGVALPAGAEMGRFNMGSTVIAVFPSDVVAWDPALTPETRVLMGQTVGRIRPAAG